MWGRPPGLRGSPWTRSWLEESGRRGRRLRTRRPRRAKWYGSEIMNGCHGRKSPGESMQELGRQSKPIVTSRARHSLSESLQRQVYERRGI